MVYAGMGAAPNASCQRCNKDVSRRLSFSFSTVNPASGNQGPDRSLRPTGEMVKCIRCSLLHWPLLKRSFIASLVVGTILTLLNQGDVLLTGQWSSAFYWKIPLTYCVPFLVATYGALVNSRR